MRSTVWMLVMACTGPPPASPEPADDAGPGLSPAGPDLAPRTPTVPTPGEPDASRPAKAESTLRLWPDADGDGYGAGPAELVAPGQPGFALTDGDCDDGNGDVWPGAPTVCGDGVVNDCEGGDEPCRYDHASSVWSAALQVTANYPDHLLLDSATGLGDVDGDGLDDVAFGGWRHSTITPGDGALYLYSGRTASTSAGLGAATATILGTAEYSGVGAFVGGPGDVDGDGYRDLLLMTGFDAWVHFGPLSGTVAVDTAGVHIDHGWLCDAASGIGDVDHDGSADLAFWENAAAGVDAQGKVHVVSYLGSRSLSVDDAHATWIAAEGVNGLGWSLAEVGDLSGDGYPELVMGAAGLASGLPAGGVVFVAEDIGRGEMSSDDADAVLHGTVAWQYASRDLAGAGDVNADGYADLLVGNLTQYSGGTSLPEQLVAGFVVLGPVAGEQSLADAAALTVMVETGAEGYQGLAVAGPGDMDGDGYDEVVFGFHHPDTLSIFYGPAEGTVLYSDADGLVRGPGGYGIGRPRTLDGAGDYDGDGLADLVAAALNFPPDPSGFVLLGSNL